MSGSYGAERAEGSVARKWKVLSLSTYNVKKFRFKIANLFNKNI